MILEETGSCKHISSKELKGDICQTLSVLLPCEGHGYGEAGRILQQLLNDELAGMVRGKQSIHFKRRSGCACFYWISLVVLARIIDTLFHI